MTSDWGMAVRDVRTSGTSPCGAADRVRLQASLLDIAGHAVVATDHDGRILYWNNESTRLFGWTAEQAVGRLVPDLTVTKADEEAIISALVAHRPWRGTLTCRAADGHRLEVDSS